MKAIWNGEVIAQSDDTVVVEGNHYFPAEALRQECFAPSEKKTFCGWKGEASYYDVVVAGSKNADARMLSTTTPANATMPGPGCTRTTSPSFSVATSSAMSTTSSMPQRPRNSTTW